MIKNYKLNFMKKKIGKFLKIYFKLPHIWISIIILFLSLIFLKISLCYYKNNDLIFSLCSNIFAGLITGLVISLISTIKGIYLYKTDSKITWLKEIHTQCLSFIKESKYLYFSKNSDFTSKEELPNKVYDLLCLGNNINTTITQSEFNKTLPFNTYKFLKKEFNYDSIEHEKINEELREKILEIDTSTLTGKTIKELFKEMDKSIIDLNKKTLNKIKELEIKIKATNIT